LYRAETAGDFDKISVSHGATKLVEERNLLLAAASADQQFHLPGVDVPAEQHHRLEIQLEAFFPPEPKRMVSPARNLLPSDLLPKIFEGLV
jgi:hypothetical protein